LKLEIITIQGYKQELICAKYEVTLEPNSRVIYRRKFLESLSDGLLIVERFRKIPQLVAVVNITLSF
jgi:hypothetical protein